MFCHSTNGSTFAQTINYKYNTRGWLSETSAPLFKEVLRYNEGAYKQFNGNPAYQVFTRKNLSGANVTQTYSYSYDKLNRLLQGSLSGSKGLEALTYDKIGNIKTLKRSATSSALVDNLTYTYAANRLSEIDDASGNTSGVYQLPGTTTFTYDANGNLKTRSNTAHPAKNINTTTYNHLNLPQSLNTTSGNITYTYDATGKKLRSVNGISGQTRDYVDGIEYVGGQLELILTEEGRIVKNGSNFQYDYLIKDHLGNNRVGFAQHTAPATTPNFTADYYPFGLQYQADMRQPSPKNNYLYNGKELQTGMGWYDYGARFYDPVIGRFTTVDPLAHEFAWQSPYSAFNNNPILYIDPNGRAAVNSQGCCGGPFDGLINFAASKVRQAAYDLTVATGKAFIQLTTAYAEHKLNQAVNSNDPFTSSAALTTEFVTGLGPAEREFGKSHPFTQSLAESNMTTEALSAFNSGYQDYLAGNREDIPSSYRVDFRYGLGGDTGPFKEFFKDGKFTAAQFTGTANYIFSLDKKGNLNIGVYDTKTEYSFMYHAPGTDRHSRSEGQIMGETTQYYNFTIPLNQVRKRVEK